MLEKLEILNGVLSQDFQKDILEYDVSVDSSVSALIFNYELSDSADIIIYNNSDLVEGLNHVLIETYKDKVTTYVLNVYKEKTETTISVGHKEEDSPKFINEYRLPIVIIACLLLFFIVFRIFYHKKHNVN